VVEQMDDVALGAREVVVHAQDVMALCNQALTQVGAEEPGSSGDQNVPAFAILHCFTFHHFLRTHERTAAGMFLSVQRFT
jgi:Tat protein secretion system quality control protein TatD with DNase activity